MGLLTDIVVFGTLLIGAEGANPSKMHSHFLRAVFIRGCSFNVQREKRVNGRAHRCECAEERRAARGSLSACSGNQQANFTEPCY